MGNSKGKLKATDVMNSLIEELDLLGDILQEYHLVECGSNYTKLRGADVAKITGLCHYSEMLMQFVKQIYIELNLLRWESITMYADLYNKYPLVCFVEKVVFSIMIDESTGDNVKY
jgi:hypothetical protein